MHVHACMGVHPPCLLFLAGDSDTVTHVSDKCDRVTFSLIWVTNVHENSVFGFVDNVCVTEATATLHHSFKVVTAREGASLRHDGARGLLRGHEAQHARG